MVATVIVKLFTPSTPPTCEPSTVNVSPARYPVPPDATETFAPVPTLSTLKSAPTPAAVFVV